MNLEQIEELIIRHFDAELTDEEQLMLATELSNSESARKLFGDYMRLEGATQQLSLANAISNNLEVGVAQTPSVVGVVPSRFDGRIVAMLLTGFAAGILAASLFFGLVKPSLGSLDGDVASSLNDTSQPTASVAKIRRLVNVRWNQPSAKRNDSLAPQTVDLESGILELQFEHGAIVRLEGPARYEIQSAEETFLHYGRLQSFSSSDSYGFKVNSNSICVVDLGTDFGIDIPRDGEAEIHVFRGETEIFEPAAKTQTRFASMLTSGQAMRIHPSGYRTKIEASLAAFADWSEVESRTQSYVADLQKQLGVLQRSNNKLVREQKDVEADVLKSRTLAKHLMQIATVENEMSDFRRKNSSFISAQEAEFEITQKLKRQVRKEAQKTDIGREVCGELETVEKRLKELAKSKRSPEDVAEYRALQKTRLRLQRRIRNIASDALKDNDKLRDLYEEQRRVHREIRETMSKSNFVSMERKLSKLRRGFAGAKRKAFAGNQRLKEIRREQKAIAKQMDQITQHIADTQWMSEAYSPQEALESESEEMLPLELREI